MLLWTKQFYSLYLSSFFDPPPVYHFPIFLCYLQPFLPPIFGVEEFPKRIQLESSTQNRPCSILQLSIIPAVSQIYTYTMEPRSKAMHAYIIGVAYKALTKNP